jgi:hypothetical protein
MISITLVDLTDKTEFNKLVALKPDNKKMFEHFLNKGRTEIGYDEKSGNILLAIENGKLLYVDNKDITFKRI